MDDPDVDATSDFIWHKQVPLKVFVLAWRLFRHRLPTKDNLATRNIIKQDAQFCVTGVVDWNQLRIYSFFAILLHLCGIRLGLGLVSL
jgi:hypothetical protein